MLMEKMIMRLLCVFLFAAALYWPLAQHAYAGRTITPAAGNGRYPKAIGVNPGTNLIYVANEGSNNVSVIDGAANKVIETIQVGMYPKAAGVNPETNLIYVANYS